MLCTLSSKYKEFMTDCRRSLASDLGLLLLRLTSGGFMLVAHGWGKLAGFAAKAESFPDPLGVGSSASLGLAVFAEVLCALFVVLGLGTRLATVPLIITMGVAAFVIHGADPYKVKEKALLYLIAYLVLFLTGPGKLSIDHQLAKRCSCGIAE